MLLHAWHLGPRDRHDSVEFLELDSVLKYRSKGTSLDALDSRDVDEFYLVLADPRDGALREPRDGLDARDA